MSTIVSDMLPRKYCHTTLFVLFIAFCLSGCNYFDQIFGGSESPITHLPVKMNRNERWGFVDLNGTVVCEDEFKNKPSPAVNGITRVTNEKGYTEYYKIGKKVEQIGDSYLKGTQFSQGKAMVVKENGHVSAIDENGQVLFVLDAKDDDAILLAGSFHEDLAPVMNARKKWGFIDGEGKFVIPCKYDAAEAFYGGYARIAADGKTKFIDKTGNVILQPKSVSMISRIQDQAFVYTEDKGEFGLMNLKGEKLISAKSKYAYMAPPRFGLIVFASGSNRDFGVMNQQGEIILRPKYDYIAIGKEHLFAVVRNRHTIAFDHTGNEKWKSDVDGILPLNSKTGISFDGDDIELIDLGDGGKTLGNETFADIGLNLREALSNTAGAELFSYAEYVSSDFSDPENALNNVLKELRMRTFFGTGQNGDYAQAQNAIQTIKTLHKDNRSVSIRGMDNRYFWQLAQNENRNEDNSSSASESPDEEMQDPFEDEAAAEPAEDASAQLKSPDLKDSAPELSLYTKALRSGKINLDRKLSMSVTIEFTAPLKTAIYEDFFNGYYTVHNAFKGYGLNPDARVNVIRVNFTSKDKKVREDTQRSIESHLESLGLIKDNYGLYRSPGVVARLIGTSLKLAYTSGENPEATPSVGE